MDLYIVLIMKNNHGFIPGVGETLLNCGGMYDMLPPPIPTTYRAKECASHDAENQKRAERQAEFEALPEWKKKLIKQRKQT